MGTLVSINVGLPQDVEWQGKVVRTAIWKRPVSGRVMARRLNIDGDGQGDLAGHGGEHRAVMVYQLESYRYWQKSLQRDDFEHGQFGENLTVDGLADDEVCIGDRYRIGAATFEVTQPRVTCYRVGLRMSNPQMPALLVSHRRPGFYLRVIEQGEIGAGDEIVRVADGQERVTVAEIDALLYLPGHPTARVELALKIPALSAGWRKSLEALANEATQGGNAGLAPAPSPPAAWTGFRRLRVAEVRRETADVSSYVLEAEDGSALPKPLAGQFVALKLEVGGGSVGLIRSYSISGPQDAGTYRISVKRAAGDGSRFLHDHVGSGDLLQVSAPRGSFTLDDGPRPVVLVSAGIGATPVLSMLHALAAETVARRRQIWWCHSARNGREHPFAAEAHSLVAKLSDGHSLVTYSKPDNTDRQGRDFDVCGHLDVALLQQHSVPQEAEFYLCGPVGFVAEITAGLRSWGVESSCIHSENFGGGPGLTPGIESKPAVAPHPPEGTIGQGPNVSFTRSGLSVPWSTRFGSLLEFAEACDVPVRWSCRAGVCHTCESGLIGGTVSYLPEPLDRPSPANVLLCCSTPFSEIELDL